MKNENPVDFFIVGFAKAGTTTLYHLLSQSREVYFPSIKEINYFATGLLDDAIQHYGKSINATNTLEKYHELFKNSCSHQIKGDASPAYIEHAEIAKRLAEYNPAAKIIITLRDPSKRAISHYLMDYRLGVCKEPLQAIIDNKSGFYYQQYIEGGFYAGKMAPYFKCFPENQIKVIVFESLIKNQSATIRELCEFLGIAYESTMILPHENKNIEPKNSLLKGLYSISFIRKFIKYIFPTVTVSLLKKIFFKQSSLIEKNDIEEKLKSFYLSDIENLKKLTGLDFSSWQ